MNSDNSESDLEVNVDQEVSELGQSEKFMAFLGDRAQEPGNISLEDIEQRLLQIFWCTQ